MAIRTHRLLLRSPDVSDLDRLVAILREPEVCRWWPNFDREKVQHELLEPDDDLVVFTIEHDAAIVGAIQYSEERDPMYRHAGIDLFLSARVHGQGLGPEAITALVRHLFEERSHHRIVIDPAADNIRAIRAYEKAGFRHVGLMQQYELGEDGKWHDGVLMELVRR